MRPLPPYPVISVGFDCSYHLVAFLINNASVPTDVPVNVSLLGNASQALVNDVEVAALQQQPQPQQQQRWHVGATFRFSAAHQGLNFTACFETASSGISSTRLRVCATFVVRVCCVCTYPHSSLYAVAVQYYSSANWQPLIQFNVVCSSISLCISNASVLPVSSAMAMSHASGDVTVPCLRIGDVVAATSRDSAAAVASAWNSSVTLMMRLNPSRVAGGERAWCVAKDVREDE